MPVQLVLFPLYNEQSAVKFAAFGNPRVGDRIVLSKLGHGCIFPALGMKYQGDFGMGMREAHMKPEEGYIYRILDARATRPAQQE
jgi:hypothetical protein